MSMPKLCVTHHHACDCREEMFAKRISKMDAIIKAQGAYIRSLEDANMPEIITLRNRIAELEAKNVALREQVRWVPVSERLPIEKGSYIGCHIPARYSHSNYIPACDDIWGVWFEYGKFVDEPDGHIENTSITHWMPLPPPPQEQDK